jgi:hypothetical protein
MGLTKNMIESGNKTLEIEEKLLEIISHTISSSRVIPFANRTPSKYPITISPSKHTLEEIRDNLNISLIVKRIARYSIFSEKDLKFFDNQAKEIKSDSSLKLGELVSELIKSTDDYLIGGKIFFEIIDPILSVFLILIVVILILIGYGTDFTLSKPGGLALSLVTTSLIYLFRFYATYDLKIASLKKILLERINSKFYPPL